MLGGTPNVGGNQTAGTASTPTGGFAIAVRLEPVYLVTRRRFQQMCAAGLWGD
jgi:hypothetical protein